MNKNNKINYFKLSGFTLVELMVAVTVLGMVTYLVVISTVSNRSSSTIAQATIFLNAQARQATSNIRRDLMEAQSSSVIMEDETPPGSGIFRRIRFKVPLVDSNGNLITTTGGDVAFGANQSQSNFIRYALNGTNLERQIVDSSGYPVGNARIIARNMSSFTVTFNSTLAQYEINLSLSVSSYEGIALRSPITFSSTIAVAPRN
jgi:prepilin-type N-terminal cleavage/methylation domain-containing protein